MVRSNEASEGNFSPSSSVTDAHRKFKLALLDLDGTLWRGVEVIPGAPEFVERLRVQGIRPVYFTNNATRTPESVVDLLGRMGFRADVEEICTSAQAAAHLLKQRIPDGGIVAYIGQEGLYEALKAHGFDARRSDGDELRSAWVEDAVGAVVGLDQNVTYRDVALMSRVARRLGWFVLTNPDVRLPVEDGFMPGNGAIGAFVATASGASHVVTGKPDPSFVAYALERYGATAEETVVVGDNLETDILAAKRAGIYSILVRTGVTSSPGLDDPEPDEIADSVANLFRQ